LAEALRTGGDALKTDRAIVSRPSITTFVNATFFEERLTGMSHA